VTRLRQLAPPHRDDALVAGVLALVSLAQVLVLLPIGSRWVGVVVALGSTLPIAWRRSNPLAAAIAGSLPWLIPTDGFLLVGYVAVFFLYYSLGAYVDDLRVVGATIALAVAIALGGTWSQHLGIGEYAGAVLALVAPPAVGRLVRRHRLRAVELERVAAQLERERDHQARIAVAEERARIARELHDIVSHAVSLVAVQADAAEAALDHDPELARAPLRTVRASAQEALDEMRRLLGVLRTADAAGDRDPLPGLADVPALVDAARAAGVDVQLDVVGEPVPLPQSLDLSAHRIVQEALTNARKHAPGAPVAVALRWEEHELELLVRDWGPGPNGPPSADAHGLVGMRERVLLHHGALTTGAPGDGRGFEVRVVLPLERA
jgi:signal transduction histidine kinase